MGNTDNPAAMKGNTVFVRNLPLSLDHQGLEDLFTSVGPIRSAFVVNGKDGKPRGIGFVKFSMQEDAFTAISSMQGHDVGGRKIKLEHADAKGKAGEKSNLKRSPLPVGGAASSAGGAELLEKREQKEKREFLQRRLAGSLAKGAAPSTSPTALSHPKAEERQLPPNSRQAAKRAASKQAKQRRSKAKSVAALAPDEQHSAHHDAGGLAGTVATAVGSDADRRQRHLGVAVEAARRLPRGKGGRLIVRNLSFQCDEEELKQLFAAHGSICDVRIPKDGAGRGRGFGFVQFADVATAAQVVQTSGDMTIRGRPVAVDFAVAKDKYKQLQEVQKKHPPASNELKEAENGGEDCDDQQERSTTIEGVVPAKAVVAAQVSVSKQESKDTKEPGGGKQDDDGENCQDAHEGKQPIHADEAQHGQRAQPSEGSAHRKLRTSAPDSGLNRSVFIRNVLFETKEDALKTAFAKFGTVIGVKLVVDQHTQRPRGTAFVEFKTEEAAAKSVEESNQGGIFHESKVLEQSTIVSAGIRQGGVFVDGRRLLVSAAVSRDKAAQLRTTEPKQKAKIDRRNLYLAAEGVIREGDAAAAHLTPAELALRANAERVKAQKLRDPSNFVSKNRLSVRNLPLLCDESQLKQLFLGALPTHNSEGYAVKGKRIPAVKIVRDNERMVAGAARSRGFGFVEFAEHEDALVALRALNNNPTAYAEVQLPKSEQGNESAAGAQAMAQNARSSQRLMVEFSVENFKAVKTLERRKQRAIDLHEETIGGKSLEHKTDDGDDAVAAGASGGQGPEQKKRKRKSRLSSKNRPGGADGSKAATAVAGTSKVVGQPQSKIRKADMELEMREDDLLASIRPTDGEEKKLKRRRRGKDKAADKIKERALESLISQYKNKYFG